AAADHMIVQHRREEEAIKRRLAEVNAGRGNLIRALEHAGNPSGRFYTRTMTRAAELEDEAADLTPRLQSPQAAAPPAPGNDLALLDRLPILNVDLNKLAVDRLHRFLDAFRVEVRYDGRVRRARVQAEISGETLDRLVHVVGWAERPRAPRVESTSAD